jgi:hypothetical protein
MVRPKRQLPQADTAKVLTFDKARRIAVNVARLPELLGGPKQKKPHPKGKASPVPSCSPELDLTIGRSKDGKCRAVVSIHNNKVRVLPMGHGSR